MRRFLRRLRIWLMPPSHDPAPYIALTVALMLTRMSGGSHDNRYPPGV